MNYELTFSEALTKIKQGEKAQRKGWNGKNMFIFLHQEIGYQESKIEPFILIKNATGTYNPWLASQQDLIAEDWGIL